MWILWISLGLINVLGLAMMGVDKGKARRKVWRIRERTLLLTAALGGSLGVYVGIYLFRHKTRHLKFTLGVPVIMVLQLWIALRLSTAGM